MKHKKYLLKNCELLDGKTVIVTGANGTIGQEIVICCLILNASVIMAVRNTEKGEAAKQKILKYFEKKKIAIATERLVLSKLDISDFNSINSFAQSISQKSGLYLINNAGALSGKSINKDFEFYYLTNFLGPMYLAMKLESQTEKVIFQSSLSYSWRKSRIDWNNVQNTSQKGVFKNYGHSKRLLTLTVASLNNPKFCLVHPGVCSTNIIPTRVLRFLCRPLFHSARTASLSAVVALSKPIPCDSMLQPRCFGIWGKPKLHKIKKKVMTTEEIAKAREHFAEVCNNKIF